MSEVCFGAILLRRKTDVIDTIAHCFRLDKLYEAHYINDPIEEQGWFCYGEDGSGWWLSPADGKNHNLFYHEKFIMDNFEVVNVVTGRAVSLIAPNDEYRTRF